VFKKYVGSTCFCLFSLFALSILNPAVLALDAPKTKLFDDKGNSSWKSIPVRSYLDAGKEVRYCEFDTEDRNKAYMIVMPLHKAKLSLEPIANNPVCTTQAASTQENTVAAVNGGYFNLHGGLSASYVTVNGQLVCDPKDNASLVNNVKLKPFLDAVFNRSELRVLVNNKGQETVRIQNHNEPLPSGYILKHALQAGPRLLPTLTAKEEAFLRTDSSGVQTDAIGVLKTAARTAIGITADDRLIVLCIAGPKQDEFSSGMTLAQLADLLKTLGCVEGMNFDGGTSTTMVVKNNNEPQCTMVCGREPQTIVKSCLLIKAEP
jgi:hypothetical protein